MGRLEAPESECIDYTWCKCCGRTPGGEKHLTQMLRVHCVAEKIIVHGNKPAVNQTSGDSLGLHYT